MSWHSPRIEIRVFNKAIVRLRGHKNMPIARMSSVREGGQLHFTSPGLPIRGNHTYHNSKPRFLSALPRIIPLLCTASFLTAAALAICCLPTAAAPTPLTVTIGDPKNPSALAPALQAAYQNGARHIVIKPGLYLLPTVGHSTFVLDGWKDTAIRAYGVTLILTDLAWNHNLFDLHNCAHVTISGPVLSQNVVTAYQGRVIAVGKDDKGSATCDFRPDAGYPVPPADPKGFLGGDVNIVDAHTRLLKVGNGDFYGVPGESLGNGTFRVHFHQAKLNFGVGDWLVGRYGNAPFKVYLGDCRDCTLQDVTLMRNGFAPLREDGGGGNHYLHCVWTLGPRPGGATEEPLVTNAADGMHMIGSFPGPDIENCVFRGVFLDDCIAIHGGFTTIKAVSGTALTLGGDGGLVVGQSARISDEHGFFGETIVTALKDNGDKTWTATLDKDLGVPVGAKLSNPRKDGVGYKIIGCQLGDTRSRGILAKADNGVIENNLIEGCGQAAISLGPEYYWGEANYVQHVLVAGNSIRGNGIATYGGGSILIHGDGAVGNRDILIQNNRFLSNYQGDIDAQWTDGLTVTNNALTSPSSWPPGLSPQSPVLLANCRHVTLKGNIVKTSTSYKMPLVATGANLTDVVGNDPSGIRADVGAKAAYVHDGSPTDTNIRYIGRWDRHDARSYHSYWGGAYLRVMFTGTSLGFQGGATAGGPNILVSLDGEPPHEVKALSVQGLKPGTHTLLAGAPNQNSEVEFQGLTLDTGAVTLPIPARPLIEFVGDSITTGGGQTLPGTVNYAWESAEQLGADHTQIAFSARALTMGYGCAGDKAALDTQYFQLKNFNHLDDKPQTPWDFSYTPQVIVINLGQNDQCGGEPDDVMTTSYVHFVQRLRARFPVTQIVALRPFGGPFAAAIRRAIEVLKADGDTRVQFIDTTGWLDTGDYVDGIHPTQAGHAKVAQRLAPLLKPLLAVR